MKEPSEDVKRFLEGKHPNYPMHCPFFNTMKGYVYATDKDLLQNRGNAQQFLVDLFNSHQDKFGLISITLGPTEADTIKNSRKVECVLATEGIYIMFRTEGYSREQATSLAIEHYKFGLLVNNTLGGEKKNWFFPLVHYGDLTYVHTFVGPQAESQKAVLRKAPEPLLVLVPRSAVDKLDLEGKKNSAVRKLHLKLDSLIGGVYAGDAPYVTDNTVLNPVGEGIQSQKEVEAEIEAARRIASRERTRLILAGKW